MIPIRKHSNLQSNHYQTPSKSDTLEWSLQKEKGGLFLILLSGRAATSSCAIINMKPAKSCDTASLLKPQVVYLFPGWKGVTMNWSWYVG